MPDRKVYGPCFFHFFYHSTRLARKYYEIWWTSKQHSRQFDQFVQRTHSHVIPLRMGLLLAIWFSISRFSEIKMKKSIGQYNCIGHGCNRNCNCNCTPTKCRVRGNRSQSNSCISCAITAFWPFLFRVKCKRIFRSISFRASLFILLVDVQQSNFCFVCLRWQKNTHTHKSKHLILSMYRIITVFEHNKKKWLRNMNNKPTNTRKKETATLIHAKHSLTIENVWIFR